jgi:hypothetical protein
MGYFSIDIYIYRLLNRSWNSEAYIQYCITMARPLYFTLLIHAIEDDESFITSRIQLLFIRLSFGYAMLILTLWLCLNQRMCTLQSCDRVVITLTIWHSISALTVVSK